MLHTNSASSESLELDNCLHIVKVGIAKINRKLVNMFLHINFSTLNICFGLEFFFLHTLFKELVARMHI